MKILFVSKMPTFNSNTDNDDFLKISYRIFRNVANDIKKTHTIFSTCINIHSSKTKGLQNPSIPTLHRIFPKPTKKHTHFLWQAAPWFAPCALVLEEIKMAETSQLHLFWICTEWKDDSIFRRWLLNRLQIRWSRFLSRHGVFFFGEPKKEQAVFLTSWPVEFPGNFANQALMRRLTRPALLACCRCSQEFPFAWGWSVFQWVFWTNQAVNEFWYQQYDTNAVGEYAGGKMILVRMGWFQHERPWMKKNHGAILGDCICLLAPLKQVCLQCLWQGLAWLASLGGSCWCWSVHAPEYHWSFGNCGDD